MTEDKKEDWFEFIVNYGSGCKIRVAISAESDMEELYEAMKAFALAAGFSPETVKEYFS